MTKRLNKKVALIGSIVFLLLVAVAVVAVLRQGGDPEEFLKNADASWQRHDYKSAEYNYMKAYQLLESDPLRVETLFKLAQLYIETDQWPKVRGCWERIINIEPGNVTARLGRLEYLYIVAENYARLGSSVSSLWSDIQSQASELIKVAEDTGILNEDKAKWETSLGASEKQPELSRSIGAYLYLVRARASLESAKVGAVTAPEQLLTTAMDDLKKVQELEPNNVNYYWFLVQTTVAKGEILASRGNLQARETAVSEAAEFLEQAVKAAPSDPRTHINLLSWRFERARRAEPEQTAQQLKALEPLYLSLVQNFPLSAEAFAELSRFYSVYSIYSGYKLSPENLDKAIGAIDKAIELDKQNVSYAISSANLHYRRFSIYGQRNEVLKAMAIATDAITFPSAKETAGPRSYAVRMNRFMLYSFLAHCYIEQILEPSQQGVESQKQDLLTKAEDVVHQIEQIFGSGDEPQVVKWQGMLELARGNTSAAVGKLYEAYEQIKASRTSEYADAELAYTLAGIFRRSSEIGAVMEFLVTALGSGIEFTRPAAILDYLESLNELGMSTHVLSAANLYNIDRFEERFGTNARSRAIRVHALIDTGRISEAEQELARLDQDDPATIRLNLDVVNSKMEQIHASTIQRQVRQDSGSFTELSPAEQPQVVSPQASEELLKAEFINHSKRRLELVQKLLTKSPGSVEEVMVAAVCRDSISQGWITQAESLIDRYLEHFPDSTVALSYKKVLSEPDPKNIPQQRRLEIEKQVLLQIKDPARQAVGLGLFYQKNNQIDEAVEQFKKVLEMPAKADTGIEVFILSNRDDPRALAADCLFEIAAQKKDWQLAEDVVQTVRQGNLDDCQGQLFAARLSAAKGEFDQALTRINECLKSRPIFSLGFLLRAHIEDGLENERASLADIRKAFSLNPLDGTIAKALANALYQRNLKLGDRISSDQESEVRQALQRAVGLNPGDLQLLSAYAEYISSTEPSKALAIRQSLQRNAPTLQNAILLARLATKMALQEKDEQSKQMLFQIAESSLQQAGDMEPQNKLVLEAYTDYYRARGEKEKAEKLLLEANDQSLLWRHYFQIGRFDDAQKMLLSLYDRQPKDTDVLAGLFLVAERAGDIEGIRKYSGELLSLEDNAASRIDQIRAYLRYGLTEDAEYKLQSLKERYPNEPGIPLLEGWLAMRQGQLKKALDLANQNLQANQNSATAWRLRGQINFLMADYDQAIDDLQKSKSLMVTSDTRTDLARAFLRTGREADAITELKNAIDAPGAPMEAMTLLEQVYVQLDKKELLQQFYDEALKRFPGSVFWHNRAAGFAMNQGNLERAAQLYKSVLFSGQQVYTRADSNSVSAIMQYTLALDGYLQATMLQAGSPNQAGGGWQPNKLNEVLEQGGKYTDTVLAPVAFYRMAEAKLKLGDRQAAIEYCRKAADAAGADDTMAGDILFRMFVLLGREEVTGYCEQKLKNSPNSPAANFTMFNLNRIEGNYGKAVEYIDRCIEQAGAESPRGISYTVNKVQVLTLAYEKTSDKTYLQKAVSDYESILAKKPNNTTVLNNLAYILAENDQSRSQALEYAKKAVEQMPDNPDLLDTFAYALYKNGLYYEADEIITRARQQYEQNGIIGRIEVYEHLGMIKEKLGQKSQALDAYEQALKIGADKLSGEVMQRINSAVKRLSQ